MALESGDFELGSLPKSSWVQCDQLHTFDQSLILGRIGKLTPEAYARVLKACARGLAASEALNARTESLRKVRSNAMEAVPSPA